MLITSGGQDFDFEKWPKWRRLDTTCEVLVFDMDRILHLEREGSTLRLYLESAMVYAKDTEEDVAAGPLVLECERITGESLEGTSRVLAELGEVRYLSGSIPKYERAEQGSVLYEASAINYAFQLDTKMGTKEPVESLPWSFQSPQVTVYWKESFHSPLL